MNAIHPSNPHPELWMRLPDQYPQQDQYGPEYLHIATAGNDTVLPGVEMLIYSAMKYNKKVVWHILTMDCNVEHDDGSGVHYASLSESDCNWLRKIVKFMDYQSELIRHDVGDLYQEHLGMNANRFSHFTPYTGLRLLSDLAFPELPAVMYIDTDIIVQGDLRPPWEQYRWNMDYNYAAHTTPGACGGFGEITGGFLIYNLRKSRETGFLVRARSFFNANEYRWMDQEAMRDADDHPGEINETYNYMLDHKLAPYKPVCLHFCMDNKFKIYTTQPGVFFRYYPEHLWIKEGIDLIRTVH